MAILLKNQLNEIVYHVPTFDRKYYDKASSFGHGNGLKSGKQMFYDFHAMELIWRMVGSGQHSSKERDNLQSKSDDDASKFVTNPAWVSDSKPMLNQPQIKFIDDLFEQIVEGISKNLINYLHLATIYEFSFATEQCAGWRRFLFHLREHYKRSSQISPELLKTLVKQYIPDMESHLDVVIKLVKYTQTYDAKYNFTRFDKELDKGTAQSELDFAADPTKSQMMTGDEPDETDYTTEIPDYPHHDYYDKIDESKLLTEEFINTKDVEKVHHAMRKANLTFDDIKIAYHNLEWGSLFGGKRWGDAITMMQRLIKYKKNGDFDNLVKAIDDTYDLQHNTGTLLNKGPMDIPKLDLDRRSEVTHIGRFLPNVSPIVKNVIIKYLKYFPSGDTTSEVDKEEISNSPTQRLSDEQSKVLENLGYIFNIKSKSYIAKYSYSDKEQKSINTFYILSAHENGKFSVTNQLKTFLRVYNSLEEALPDIKFKNIVNWSVQEKYLLEHTPMKLSAKKEQELLNYKMAWRPHNHCYKAYFNNEILYLFAATDGTCLLAYHTKPNISVVYKNFEDALHVIKSETLSANENPYKFASQKAINAELGIVPASPTNPAPVSEYSVELPMELQKKLEALGFSKQNSSANGKYKIFYTDLNKCQLSTMNTGGTVMWTPTGVKFFKSFDDAYAHLLVDKNKSSSVPPTTDLTTDKGYTGHGLPPHSPSEASYVAHKGLTTPPPPIRLTKEDEDILISLGYKPIAAGGTGPAYLNDKKNIYLRFYPDDTLKIIPSGKAIYKLSGIKSCLAGGLESTIAGITTPASSPVTTTTTPLTSTSSMAGVKLGSMIEQYITKAGFGWDAEARNYKNPSNGDILITYQNRSAKLKTKALAHYEEKSFPNLEKLVKYLNEEYKSKG